MNSMDAVFQCKVAEAGSRLKKKEWSPCYIFLSSAHIIFYKDEKSAEVSDFICFVMFVP